MRCSRGAAVGMVVLAFGCVAPDAESASLPLGEAALVAIDEPGPSGLDAPPACTVAFRVNGALGPSLGLAIGYVPRWRSGAALVDPARRLYEVQPSGARRMLAEGVTGSLAVSDDARLLAYVIARDVFGELHVHDGERERGIARGLASIGALRFADGHVLFVGGAPGGVAGVWAAPLDGTGARCLTNCALVTGQPWQAVPLPASASALELVDGRVRWRDADGLAHEARLARAP